MRKVRKMSASRRFWQPPERDLLAGTLEFFKELRAIHRCRHLYRNGTAGEEYADLDQIVSDPSRLECVLSLFSESVQEIRRETPLDFLAFIDKGSSGYGGSTVGAILLASGLSLKTYLPFVLVRHDRRAMSEKVKMPAIRPDEVDSLVNLTGVLITDHIGQGGEALEAIAAIEHAGGRISHCLSYTCRTALIQQSEFAAKGVEVRWFHDFPPVGIEPQRV